MKPYVYNVKSGGSCVRFGWSLCKFIKAFVLPDFRVRSLTWFRDEHSRETLLEILHLMTLSRTSTQVTQSQARLSFHSSLHRVKVHWILSSGLRNRITAITEIKTGEIKEEKKLERRDCRVKNIVWMCIWWTSTTFYLNCYPRVCLRKLNLEQSKILPKKRKKLIKILMTVLVDGASHYINVQPFQKCRMDG